MLSAEDARLRDRITADLELFSREAVLVFEELVLPRWNTELHGLTNTLYGYLARAYGFIDLASRLWRGTINGSGQTARMLAFMKSYLGASHEVANVSIQLWRHTLVHTTRASPLVIERTGARYRWLLHWGAPHLPREQHFVITTFGNDRKLGTGLLYLLDDLRRAWGQYATDLDEQPTLQDKFSSVRAQLEAPSYRP